MQRRVERWKGEKERRRDEQVKDERAFYIFEGGVKGGGERAKILGQILLAGKESQ